MASLRLNFVHSVLMDARRIEAKLCFRNNLGVIFRRTNHSLCQCRLITAINQDSPKLLSNLHKYRLVYRLEHGIPAADNVTSAVKDITQGSKSLPESIDTQQMVESISGTGNLNNTKRAIENSNILNESMLPPIPDNSFTIIEEASLKSLGLAGWTPSGIIGQILEFFHVSFDMPWWAAIAALTLTLRFFMVPFTIKIRRNTTNYANNLPQFQHLQSKLTEAKLSGSYYEIARCGQELSQFIQEKKVFSPGMVVPHFVQMPVFVSVFFALKKMSETPELKSFETGGLFWFTDLSVPDQFYILPLMTAGTVWLTLKFGDSSKAIPTSSVLTKIFIDILAPCSIFLFTMQFPAAVSCYWITTNIFVLLQSQILSIEPIRKYFDIPKYIVDVPSVKPRITPKSITQSFKETVENMKLSSEIEDRERLNAIKFEKNASAPIRRTFKFNPKEIANREKKKGAK